jgi:hypothetical protein
MPAHWGEFRNIGAVTDTGSTPAWKFEERHELPSKDPTLRQDKIGLMSKLMTAATALGRLALRRAGNDRVLRAGYSAAKATLRSMNGIARTLWLQITGVFFCLFALTFAFRLPHTYASYTAGKTPAGYLLLLLALTVLFAWFGVSSFWKVKRK